MTIKMNDKGLHISISVNFMIKKFKCTKILSESTYLIHRYKNKTENVG